LLVVFGLGSTLGPWADLLFSSVLCPGLAVFGMWLILVQRKKKGGP
jgi:hypothetical protein